MVHLALDAWLLRYGPDYSAASLDDFMKHLHYLIDLVGIDHVGVGSDFDGGGGLCSSESGVWSQITLIRKPRQIIIPEIKRFIRQ